MLRGKKIIVGVTGGIAAYKSAMLVRLLIKAGAEVQVLMTPAAHEFITPLTLATLSKRPVHTLFHDSGNGTWNNHVDLGLWADLMIIAPATADTLAKMANGICDNLLLAVYLSARCPVSAAPAMDLDMYRHPSTQRNLAQLRADGVHLIPPGNGELASGLHGEGRMAEPEEILAHTEATLSVKQRLKGRKILVTAGPTYEPIDPVRFIGNHSSGKMGLALAETLAGQGARVILVCGPTSLQVHHPNIQRVDVMTAKEMYTACTKVFGTCHAAILSAAVADYRPAHASKSKIKKDKSRPFTQIELEETADILAELGRRKKSGQVLAGFALETDNEIEHAKAKLKKKNLDFIVLNSLREKGAGFAVDTNRITIIGKNNKTINFEVKAKTAVAVDIADYLAGLMEKKS
ncbi:MAG: phosphopantothenoylcysteine decarboxylase/phosphopantothenate--cysteine ligase [Bacteroidetes bacterium]|nr:MAG: phosphopantothenoylcysteine decarboxylase/phosphopantothenate--cysteine ligase [Bacteroidota bacterium]